MLQFDDSTARILEDAYQWADFTRRRRANFDALAAQPGQTVLDLGCGNGLLTEDLSRAVGDAGRVHGVDPSAAMLQSARVRLAGRENVTLAEGTAAALPLADGSLDGAVSVQVFEYVDDVPAALAELHRALRPGGRLVIGDMHFGTYAWRSDDPDRMRRMQAAWDRHLVHPDLPERLPEDLARAGFTVRESIPVTLTDRHYRPDSLVRMMIILMTRYAIAQELLPEAEVRAWADEQAALAEAGRFFFSLTHFVTVAERN
ncbi:methyltransferase domain-containing protein [Psychromarinibacter sp. C21-152]|uniref:Methyltransferase domain-containing protein n=1 Tax=Psychromarinibacter sediminicola TaxID=3033385 RepID=A0AAE3T753_9RHOB|nr:methyltransferase domain-containing protein [Psychromarinibacter sediminicola]MDF0599962.1 methyltransferase domain-containing protein [Psychromarinibacter sediminicola]